MSNPKKDTKTTITDLKKVAGGVAAPGPSVKNEPQLPQAPKKNILGDVSYAELDSMSAGAAASAALESFPGSGSTPQIPEIFPAPSPSKHIKTPGVSIEDLSNMSAGAGVPGPNIDIAGPGVIEKPKLRVGTVPSPVQAGGENDIT